MRDLLKQALGLCAFSTVVADPSCMPARGGLLSCSPALYLCEHLLRVHRIEPGSESELYHV